MDDAVWGVLLAQDADSALAPANETSFSLEANPISGLTR